MQVDYKKLNEGLPDLQNTTDGFIQKHIHKVGINNYKVPIILFNPATKSNINTISTVSAYCSLTEDKKGVNMSRFSMVITEVARRSISSAMIKDVLESLKMTLEANDAFVKFKFDYLVEVEAPESKIKSWFNIPCVLSGNIDHNNNINKYLEVNVNYTSLCPCSREISSDGAHNQRSNARITIELTDNVVLIEELKQIVDDSSSCPIFNTLKRIDEKWVTETAYNNPAFSEDTCRSIADKVDKLLLNNRIKDYVVVSENYESIHQSNAVAVITANRNLK